MAIIRPGLQQSAQKALPGSANLANLLPTGNVFVLQTLIISFSNNGNCEMTHMYMTLALGAILLCLLASYLPALTASWAKMASFTTCTAKENENEFSWPGSRRDYLLTLLHGLCKHGHVHETLDIFRVIHNNGIEPYTVHYNILIDGLFQVGQLNVARKLCCALPVKGLHPSVYTWSIMIKGLCKEGLPNEAYELFKKMDLNGCLQDSCSYNVMIKGFFQNNDVSRAMQILHEIVDKGFSADSSTARMLLDILCRDGGDQSIFELLGRNCEDDQNLNMK
ncbi:Pentatricopeptide repeat (PPR) superfamily protein [Theobroma cacao]|uniref:Pentatricopeptide repeat (PPR) superfamily protein n=1 Tax=Theobroma cacao TaxID=3641 RepID=A0A061F2L0_THECC|nr:Pentatricopeptide repeat (PPR) superfamily protein [Theobroma cacao]